MKPTTVRIGAKVFDWTNFTTEELDMIEQTIHEEREQRALIEERKAIAAELDKLLKRMAKAGLVMYCALRGEDPLSGNVFSPDEDTIELDINPHTTTSKVF